MKYVRSLMDKVQVLLRTLGLGAAGLAASAAATPEHIFAKQFVGEGTAVNLPKMVYDESLQMMVDPVTRQPIYEDAKKIRSASGLPTITSGCDDCPKKDDDGE